MQIVTLSNLGASFSLVGTKIEVRQAIVTKSVSYTLTGDDSTVVMLTAATTATLPTSSAKKQYIVKNGSSGSISVAGSIDGITTTLVVPSGESLVFHGDGGTWWLI